MSFRPDSPVELPNGRLVCGPHRLVVCPYCTVDYSFMLSDEEDWENSENPDEDMDDLDDEDEDDDDEEGDKIILPIDHGFEFDFVPTVGGLSRLCVFKGFAVFTQNPAADAVIGTGKAIPMRFTPPKSYNSPNALFPPGIGRNTSPQVYRFINRNNPAEFLIHTDGACLDNGSEDAKAGCAFLFKNTVSDRLGHQCFRLESKGPTGQSHKQTSNRAELRAVIAASKFREWDGEGCRSLVFATDSEYVVEGATSWVRRWLRKGWRTSTGEPVKNKDLWQCLLGECEKWADRGVKVSFWRIPREWNTEADRWAKHAAANGRPLDKFSTLQGTLV